MEQKVVRLHDFAETIKESFLCEKNFLCSIAAKEFGYGAQFAVEELLEGWLPGFKAHEWALTIPSFLRATGQMEQLGFDDSAADCNSTIRLAFLDRLLRQPNRRVVLPLVSLNWKWESVNVGI